MIDIRKGTSKMISQERQASKTFDKKNEKSVGAYPRIRGEQTCCILERNIFMFGGKNLKEKFNDLWKFNTQTFEWQEVITKGNKPNPRSGHSMIYFNGHLAIFGGIECVTQEKNDFYKYNILTKT